MSIGNVEFPLKVKELRSKFKYFSRLSTAVTAQIV